MNEDKTFEQELEKATISSIFTMFNDEKTKITFAGLTGEPVILDRLRKICEKLNPIAISMGFSGFALDSDDKALWKSANEFSQFLLNKHS